MDPRGLRVTQTTYFSLLTHAKQLLLVTLFDPTAGIIKWAGRVRRRLMAKGRMMLKDGQT